MLTCARLLQLESIVIVVMIQHSTERNARHQQPIIGPQFCELVKPQSSLECCRETPLNFQLEAASTIWCGYQLMSCHHYATTPHVHNLLLYYRVRKISRELSHIHKVLKHNVAPYSTRSVRLRHLPTLPPLRRTRRGNRLHDRPSLCALPKEPCHGRPRHHKSSHLEPADGTRRQNGARARAGWCDWRRWVG